jgi:hypothetical protein
MQDDHTYPDHFFAESLKAYREKPPVHSWRRLEEDLLAARRHRRVVMYRWTAAAAVLVIALLAGYYILNPSGDRQLKEKTVAQTETPVTAQPLQESIQPDHTVAGIQAETTQAILSTTAESPADLPSRSTGSQVGQPVSGQTTEQEAIATLQPDKIQEEAVTDQVADNVPTEPTSVTKETPDVAKPEQKNIITPPLPDFTFLEQPEKNEYDSRWSIGGSFAPVYAYRSIQINAEELPPDVNPDMNYYNDAEEPIYSYSGGLDLSVQMKNKWEFQTGLYISSLGHINEDVIAFEVKGVKDLLKTSTSTGVIEIVTSSLPEEFVDNSVRRDSLTDAVYISSNIRQTFTYLELPLLVRYSFLDRRFGLHLTGGLSPGIMTDYHAQFTYEDEQIDLDNEGDFSTMIYNSQVGLGLNYHITRSLSINLDPSFKYSLNSIRKDHSIQYHPYSISIFTGLRYNF